MRDFVIASLHRKAPPTHHEKDAIRVQDALLGNVSRTDWDGVAIIFGTLAAMAVAAWWLA